MDPTIAPPCDIQGGTYIRRPRIGIAGRDMPREEGPPRLITEVIHRRPLATRLNAPLGTPSDPPALLEYISGRPETPSNPISAIALGAGKLRRPCPPTEPGTPILLVH